MDRGHTSSRCGQKRHAVPQAFLFNRAVGPWGSPREGAILAHPQVRLCAQKTSRHTVSPVAHNAPCPQARQQEGEERAQCKLIMGINGAMGSPQQKPMSQDHFTDALQTSLTLPRMLGNWQEPAVQYPPEHSQKVGTPFSGRWK